MRRVLFTGPTLASNASDSVFWASVYAKCISISIFQADNSTAVAAFRDAEMWIRLKAPAVSDGNNFGVDVQNFVLGEVQHMRAAMEAMTTTGRDYHWSRAQGLEKLF